MLNKLKQRKQKESGFTIIEVMIVLAIAGLILLVVFLAVPALQRNSRNTTLKADVAAVAGGISTYVSDNNGSFPAVVCGTGSVVIGTGTCAAPTNTETAKVQGATAVSTVASAPTATITNGTIQVVLGNTCSTATGGTGVASARSAALYYNIEASGGPKLVCQDT